MRSQVFETSGEAWRFIQQQSGKHFRWTYAKVQGGWQARKMTSAEYKKSQQTFSDLRQAHQNSLPR